MLSALSCLACISRALSCCPLACPCSFIFRNLGQWPPSTIILYSLSLYEGEVPVFICSATACSAEELVCLEF